MTECPRSRQGTRRRSPRRHERPSRNRHRCRPSHCGSPAPRAPCRQRDCPTRGSDWPRRHWFADVREAIRRDCNWARHGSGRDPAACGPRGRQDRSALPARLPSTIRPCSRPDAGGHRARPACRPRPSKGSRAAGHRASGQGCATRHHRTRRSRRSDRDAVPWNKARNKRTRQDRLPACSGWSACRRLPPCHRTMARGPNIRGLR